jgi:hypothetical protein
MYGSLAGAFPENVAAVLPSTVIPLTALWENFGMQEDLIKTHTTTLFDKAGSSLDGKPGVVGMKVGQARGSEGASIGGLEGHLRHISENLNGSAAHRWPRVKAENRHGFHMSHLLFKSVFFWE